MSVFRSAFGMIQSDDFLDGVLRLLAAMGEGDDFAQQARACGLDPHHHQKDSQQQDRSIAQREPEKDLLYKEEEVDHCPGEEQDHSDQAKKAQRLLRKSSDKMKREDIDRALQVFGKTAGARVAAPFVVLAFDFPRLEASSRRENRQETVHVPVKPSLCYHLAAEDPDSGTDVMQLRLRDSADNGIEYFRLNLVE